MQIGHTKLAPTGMSIYHRRKDHAKHLVRKRKLEKIEVAALVLRCRIFSPRGSALFVTVAASLLSIKKLMLAEPKREKREGHHMEECGVDRG